RFAHGTVIAVRCASQLSLIHDRNGVGSAASTDDRRVRCADNATIDTSRRHFMVLTVGSVGDLGQPAPNFKLPGVDGRTWALADARGPNGVVVMFICNHCPYVKAVRDRIIRDVRDLESLGVRAVAISSNDPTDYPEDSFDNMKRVAREYG